MAPVIPSFLRDLEGHVWFGVRLVTLLAEQESSFNELADDRQAFSLYLVEGCVNLLGERLNDLSYSPAAIAAVEKSGDGSLEADKEWDSFEQAQVQGSWHPLAIPGLEELFQAAVWSQPRLYG
jgi:hypothetical protein